MKVSKIPQNYNKITEAPSVGHAYDIPIYGGSSKSQVTHHQYLPEVIISSAKPLSLSVINTHLFILYREILSERWATMVVVGLVEPASSWEESVWKAVCLRHTLTQIKGQLTLRRCTGCSELATPPSSSLGYLRTAV